MLRVFSVVVVAAMATLLWTAEPSSRAESSFQTSNYPNRTIILLVPFAAGGTSDTITRILSTHISGTLGRPIVVENVAGSGGTTASLRAKRAVPDGYTLLLGNMGTQAAAVGFYPMLGYDPRTDFEPIGLLTSTPIVILGNKNLPPNDLREFILYAK